MTSEPTAVAGPEQTNGSGELIAARRYALAAFEIANEHGEIAAWQDALAQIAEFMGDPEVQRVLGNVRVGQQPKLHLVDAALRDLPELPLNLARLLVRKNRTALAGDIAGVFTRLSNEKRGISHARATTAVPLSDAERDALAARLHEQTGNEIILDVDVDPALLGGVVIQIGDRLIDASTRARLQAMRDRLMGAV